MISIYEEVLRTKCNNTKLYRSDAKLASWWNVPESRVQEILKALFDDGVIVYAGQSRTGKQIFHIQPPAIPDFPEPVDSGLTNDPFSSAFVEGAQ